MIGWTSNNGLIVYPLFWYVFSPPIVASKHQKHGFLQIYSHIRCLIFWPNKPLVFYSFKLYTKRFLWRKLYSYGIFQLCRPFTKRALPPFCIILSPTLHYAEWLFHAPRISLSLSLSDQKQWLLEKMIQMDWSGVLCLFNSSIYASPFSLYSKVQVVQVFKNKVEGVSEKYLKYRGCKWKNS